MVPDTAKMLPDHPCVINQNLTWDSSWSILMGSLIITPFLSGLQIQTESRCAQIHCPSQILGRMMKKQKSSICALDTLGGPLPPPACPTPAPGLYSCPEPKHLGKLGASLSRGLHPEKPLTSRYWKTLPIRTWPSDSSLAHVLPFSLMISPTSTP